LSLATSLTPTSFVPAMVSSLRPLSMYANHGSPLLHHPSLAFRHLQSPLMSHPPSPSQSYLQGLYSQSSKWTAHWAKNMFQMIHFCALHKSALQC
jgi:hypothetical protein